MRLLFVDASTKLQTVRDLETNARGGMVTSLFKITDYLASCGHDVSVCSDIAQEGVTPAGVKWYSWRYGEGEYDCIVSNRGTGDGYPQISARHRVLWTHDLPHAGFIPTPETVGAFSLTVFMSNYAERIWRCFYRDIGRSTIIPNGVDKDIFRPLEKDPRKLIYASAPNRGLDRLPFIVDAVRASGRDVSCVAYSNLAKLHPGEADTFDYTQIADGTAVDLRDPIPQAQLARELGSAAMLLMPSSYPEICSNIILQALACRTPIVTTGSLGSAGEWVRHRKNGMLTEFQPHDYMVYTMEFVRNICEAMETDLSLGATVLSWDQVGHKWERMLCML